MNNEWGRLPYPEILQLNGYYKGDASWVLNNQDLVISILRQVCGQPIWYMHRHNGTKDGILHGIITKQVGVFSIEKPFEKVNIYTLVIAEGYKKRRLALKTTRIWHPALHAAYLISK